MGSEIGDVLAVYTATRVFEEVWFAFRLPMLLAGLWLMWSTFEWSRCAVPIQARRNVLPQRPASRDLITIPVQLAVLFGVREVASLFESSIRFSPEMALAVTWLVAVSTAVGLAIVLALVFLAAVIGYRFHGVSLIESMRLGLPGLAAAASLGGIWFAVWGVVQAFQLER